MRASSDAALRTWVAARAVIEALRTFDGPQAERGRADALLELMQRFAVLGR